MDYRDREMRQIQREEQLKERLYQVAKFNSKIITYLRAYEIGNFTWEEMLFRLITDLVATNKALEERVVEYEMGTVRSIFLKVEKMPKNFCLRKVKRKSNDDTQENQNMW